MTGQESHLKSFMTQQIFEMTNEAEVYGHYTDDFTIGKATW